MTTQTNLTAAYNADAHNYRVANHMEERLPLEGTEEQGPLTARIELAVEAANGYLIDADKGGEISLTSRNMTAIMSGFAVGTDGLPDTSVSEAFTQTLDAWTTDSVKAATGELKAQITPLYTTTVEESDLSQFLTTSVFSAEAREETFGSVFAELDAKAEHIAKVMENDADKTITVK